MDRIHVDVAHYSGTKILVIVDAYSNMIDAHIIRDLSTNAVIKALCQSFKYFGLPISLVSDNGTNFVSDEFETFCQNNLIRHIQTPPGHHQSNGQVEKTISMLKSHLNKSTSRYNLLCLLLSEKNIIYQRPLMLKIK